MGQVDSQFALKDFLGYPILVSTSLCIVLVVLIALIQPELLHYFPLVILGTVILYYALHNTLFWISTSILLQIVLFVEKSEGITLYEIIFAVYFYIPLSWWFVKRFIVNGKISITSLTDKLFITFIGIVSLSFLWAILNGNPITKWLREYLVFTQYLFYFPIKEELIKNQRKVLMTIGISFITLGLIICLKHFFGYLFATRSITYFWQIISSRQTSTEAIIGALVLISALLYFIGPRQWYYQALYILTMIFSIIALAITFSRGAWIATIISLLVAFFVTSWEEKKIIIIKSVVLVLLCLFAVYIFFGDLANLIIEAIYFRFTTSSIKDPSLYNRLIETEGMWSAIKQNPILGYGLGYFFTYRDVILGHTLQSAYGHNSYLYLWMKVGIFGLISYLCVLILMLRDGVRALNIQAGALERIALLGSIAFIASTFLMAFYGSVFYEKDAVLVYGLCFGIISGLSQSTS